MKDEGWRETIKSMNQKTVEWETIKVLLLLMFMYIATVINMDTILVIIPLFILISFTAYLLLVVPIAIILKYDGPIPFIRSMTTHFWIYFQDYIALAEKQVRQLKGGF